MPSFTKYYLQFRSWPARSWCTWTLSPNTALIYLSSLVGWASRLYTIDSYYSCNLEIYQDLLFSACACCWKMAIHLCLSSWLRPYIGPGTWNTLTHIMIRFQGQYILIITRRWRISSRSDLGISKPAQAHNSSHTEFSLILRLHAITVVFDSPDSKS